MRRILGVQLGPVLPVGIDGGAGGLPPRCGGALGEKETDPTFDRPAN
jgi:hypothetical protein